MAKTWPDDYINKIICGDCEEMMRSMFGHQVDLVFYDPPYNVKKKYANYSDNLSNGEYLRWMGLIASYAEYISKTGIVVYVGGKLTKDFFSILPDNAHLIVVHKRAAGIFARNYMLQYHSLFSTAKPLIKCKDLWDDVRLPGEGYFFREKRYPNPGMTSLEMTKKVLHHFTKEDDIVLDPFMGCGTTAQACIEMNRKFIGIDISQEYCDIANERIKTVV